jgi:hypothetical protein
MRAVGMQCRLAPQGPMAAFDRDADSVGEFIQALERDD